jgi:cytochrome c biogenesis protein CcmG, thiol:disulfide interchange protein DsbE
MGRLGPVVVALAVMGAACSSDASFRFVALSGPMPALAGETVSGPPINPALYEGKVILINVWATWCGPCRREQPGLERLWRKLRPLGDVQFIGIDHLDNASKARQWIADYGVTYPSLIDPQGSVAESFDVPFLPATILVDRDGRLRYRLVGEQKPEFLEGLLEAVLASPSAP